MYRKIKRVVICLRRRFVSVFDGNGLKPVSPDYELSHFINVFYHIVFQNESHCKKSIWFLVGAQFLIAKNIQSNQSDFIVVIQTEFICFEFFVRKVRWHFLRLTIPSNVSVFKMNLSLRENQNWPNNFQISGANWISFEFFTLFCNFFLFILFATKNDLVWLEKPDEFLKHLIDPGIEGNWSERCAIDILHQTEWRYFRNLLITNM